MAVTKKELPQGEGGDDPDLPRARRCAAARNATPARVRSSSASHGLQGEKKRIDAGCVMALVRKGVGRGGGGGGGWRGGGGGGWGGGGGRGACTQGWTIFYPGGVP